MYTFRDISLVASPHGIPDVSAPHCTKRNIREAPKNPKSLDEVSILVLPPHCTSRPLQGFLKKKRVLKESKRCSQWGLVVLAKFPL
jgi:hypothetical protein